VDTLCHVLGIEVSFRDPGVEVFGLRNAVMPIGDGFLEVVSPVKEGTTAGRFLERRGGDGGYMVIVQSQAKDEDRRRVGELGVRIAWEMQLEDAGTLHLHPRDVGGAILSLDWMDPAESWKWAGPDWRSHVCTGGAKEIRGVAIEAVDPLAMAARWGEVLDVRCDGDEPRLRLDGGGRIEFVPGKGQGEGVGALLVSAADAEGMRARARERRALDESGAIRIAGTRIHIED